MSKYGLTQNGPNIKRLDVILNEMHNHCHAPMVL